MLYSLSMTTAQLPASRHSALPPRGDRVYGAIRWLALLLVAVLLASPGRLFPWPPAGSDPASLTFWGYALFTVAATALLFVPGVSGLLPWLYIGDLLGLAALSYAVPARSAAYENLFFLPLAAVALRFPRGRVLLLSLMAALLSLLLGVSAPDRDLLATVSRMATLLTLPLLVNMLAENWTSDNRQSVRSAEQRVAEAVAQAADARARMQALYQVAATLGTTSSTGSVLESILGACAQVMPYRAGAILLPTDVRDQLGVAAGRNLTPTELQARFTIAGGALSAILRGANGGAVPGAAAQMELEALPALTSCKTLLVIPLRSGLKTYGLVVLGSDEEQLTVEHMDMATTIANYGIVAVRNARLIAELRSQRDTLLEREDEMRRQLNRDLHDGPAQALAAITMSLEFIKRLMEREPARVNDELEKVTQMARRANQDVRTLLFELRPMSLDSQGLFPTLELYLERFKEGSTKVLLEGRDFGLVDKAAQAMLFNITQESVNNALKHARAQHIWVRLRRDDNVVHLEIEDDGSGFDLSRVRESYDERGSFGLMNIEERARLVNGVAYIESRAGKGTKVTVAVPVE